MKYCKLTDARALAVALATYDAYTAARNAGPGTERNLQDMVEKAIREEAGHGKQ